MIIDKDKYISHLQDPDKVIAMRKIIDKIEIVLNNHLIESTDFLDPYEITLARSILNGFNQIDYIENHGIIGTERKILTIYPYYKNPDDLEHKISLLSIRGELEGLSHKDYLGAILNLGINRLKVGDILLHDEKTDILVKKEIRDFILFNLEKVSNRNIKIEEIPLSSFAPGIIKFKELNKVLSSYRLDVYISRTYNLSRQESMSIIKAGNVKVNWEPIDKPSKELNIGDNISIRGKGRSTLYSVEGISKKNKIRASIRILL